MMTRNLIRIYSLFYFMTCALLSAAPRLEQDDQFASAQVPKELLQRSEWWPLKVGLTQSFESPGGKTLEPGREGILIRVEADGPIIDFGNRGLFQLPIGKTDLLERASNASIQRNWEDDGGIFSDVAFRHCFFLSEKGLALGGILRIKPFDYFLLVYVKASSEQGAEFLDWIEEYPPEILPEGLCLVLIPYDEKKDDLVIDLVAFNYQHFTFIPPMAIPYIKVFQHDPYPGSWVLLDKNGKMLIDTKPLNELIEQSPAFHTVDQAIKEDQQWRARDSDQDTEG